MKLNVLQFSGSVCQAPSDFLHAKAPESQIGVGQVLKTMVACLWMLKNHFRLVFDFGGLFAVVSNVHTFEVTHSWINVLRAEDVVAKLVLRFLSKFCWIGRKLMKRVMMVFRGPMIAIICWLTLLL